MVSRDDRLNKLRCLEEIDLSDIIDYPQVDEGIKNLVRALRGLGLITMGSCEGHLCETHNPFPWVTAFGIAGYAQPEIRKKMLRIIRAYNKRSRVKWLIEGNALRPLIEASSNEQLRILRGSANSLARFLFDNYIRIGCQLQYS